MWDLLCWPTFLIDAAAGNTVKIDPSQLNLSSNLEPTVASKSTDLGAAVAANASDSK